MTNSESCSENSSKNSVTPKPCGVPSFFLYDLGANAVGFFHFVFFVYGLASFVVFLSSSFLRVAVRKNFRGRTFVFECRGWSCVF